MTRWSLCRVYYPGVQRGVFCRFLSFSASFFSLCFLCIIASLALPGVTMYQDPLTILWDGLGQVLGLHLYCYQFPGWFLALYVFVRRLATRTPLWPWVYRLAMSAWPFETFCMDLLKPVFRQSAVMMMTLFD